MEARADERISYSRVMQYLNCGYKYWFNYVMGYTSIISDQAPTLGSAGHEGMAAGILGRSVDQALEEWANNYVINHSLYNLEDEEIMGTLVSMTQDVIHQASIIVPRALDDLHLEDWETIEYNGHPMVEMKCLVPLRGWPGGFVAVLDWVAKYKPTQMTWLIDHKFRKQLQDEDSEEVNLQMPSYQKILMDYGIPTVGSMSNQILAKLPSEPKLNKDGSMSRSKIATTWDKYKECLLVNGLDPNNYVEMKDKLTTEFFRQVYSYRSPAQVMNTWDNVIEKTANEMAFQPSFVRNLGHLGCKKCWVRDYCMEELRGGDTNWLLESQYMPRSLAHHGMEITEMEEEEIEIKEETL